MALERLTEKTFKVSQKFGNKLIINGVDIYKQSWLNGHNGIDYATPSGTKLLATISWTAEVINQWKKWYGLYVKIFKKRDDGVTEVIYAHLTDTPLKTWDTVTVWQYIGTSGWNKTSPTSWTSTGAHLHFWLRFRNLNNEIQDQKNWFLWWIDPMPFFNK